MKVQYVNMNSCAKLQPEAQAIKSSHVGTCLLVHVYNTHTQRVLLAHVESTAKEKDNHSIARYLKSLSQKLSSDDQVTVVRNNDFPQDTKLVEGVVEALKAHSPRIKNYSSKDGEVHRLSLTALKDGSFSVRHSRKKTSEASRMLLIDEKFIAAYKATKINAVLENMKNRKAEDPDEDFPLNRFKSLYEKNGEKYIATLKMIHESKAQLYIQTDQESTYFIRDK
ncbi:MAG: hypothetical protein IT497_05835 [Ottowia sp.]|nr:hypothetical protein [Ottowia sp.]